MITRIEINGRPDVDEYFINMAKLVASRSTCLRRAVGCVLVNSRNHVIATGYNGVAAGQPHCNEPTDRVSTDDLVIRETYVPIMKVDDGGSVEECDQKSESLLYTFQDELKDEFGESSPPLKLSSVAGPPQFDVYANACPGSGAKSGTNLDGCRAIHAEQNALLQCRDVYDIDTVYVTTEPCVTCTKLFLGTSARRVVFAEAYAHEDARRLWYDSRGRAAMTWVSYPGRNNLTEYRVPGNK